MWVSSFIYSGIILNSFSRYYKAHITKAETASMATKAVIPVQGGGGWRQEDHCHSEAILAYITNSRPV